MTWLSFVSKIDCMSAVAAVQAMPELSERDAQILDFENIWYTVDSSKEAEIRDRFGLSTTRYYQILNALIVQPAALAYSPLLVKRLRRLRERRQRARSAERLNVG